ncbi:acetyltransferase [Phaeobacter inhibens]|uniref:GNAT family N-acetyltransferase n=1 Tax=Phaeobacter inhibens TaxID=221822 RepID=UPI00277752E2|nr:GNAT family N-acetyltransferase [Phaeobacter inhibens]GLO72636.1 acetyltransferase [Phaeobacter inhibens]
MQKDLLIRTASAEDIDALLDLYALLSPGDERCIPELAEENIRRISQIAGSAVLLGLLEDKVLTTCTTIVIPNLTKGGRPYAIIENMVTHPDARGKGLGTTILDAACDRAWENGCYKVMLSTGSARRSTLSFYENAGFEQSRTGFQKRRLPKRVE